MGAEDGFDLSKLPAVEFEADLRKLRPLIDRMDEHITSWQKLAPVGSEPPPGIVAMKSLRARMETAMDLITIQETLPPELQAETLIQEFMDITINK